MILKIFRTLLLVSVPAVMLASCAKEDQGGKGKNPPLTGGLDPNKKSELAVPAIISDNMVLLQDSDARIWGRALPGSKITVKVTWASEKAETITDSDGNWELKVRTPKASSETYMMDITDSQRGWVRVRNILVGEVWMCSGQSNMEMPMRGFGSTSTGNYQPVKDSEDELSGADFPEFRYFKVGYAELDKACNGKLFDVREGCSWQVCTPANAREYSAIAFFFGRRLLQEQKVPVGMIGCSYGGTPIAAWMPDQDVPVPAEKSSPGILYNGMVWPVHNYTLRGVLWYQGESDCDNPEYDDDMVEMVSKWRRDMGVTPDQLPFYYAQISAWGSSEDYRDTEKALMRERQLNVMQRIPNSGIVCTSDVGDKSFIHYPDKKVPAERFWLWAAKNQYGHGDTDPMGPTYRSMEVSDGKIIVTFDHAESLSCGEGNIPYVRIAGSDKVFHDAQAVLGPDSNQMTVSSPSVPEPVAVRYCFTTWEKSTVYNEDGLPVFPFRTDKW